MNYVDLHCHSTASDGTMAPEAVVRLAKANGLTGLALTDHDTIGGVAAAAREAAAQGIDFLPGIEISATFPQPGTLHILGYGVDPQSEILHDLTRGLIDARENRNPRIIAKLNELGIAITMAEVEAQAMGNAMAAAPEGESTAQVIGRPHIAAVLLKKGYVTSIKNAFDRYLGQGGSAYFDKERLEPSRAFELIRQSGGVAVLAHPIQLRAANDGELNRVIKDLVDMGLSGIEVIHSDHDAAWVEKCSGLAERYNLLKTGGSDFHGSNKKDINLGIAGGRKIPRSWFDALVVASQALR
jgi:predicted metal-dependent phosphoesterase TrpH